jgi:hypothetical protein
MGAGARRDAARIIETSIKRLDGTLERGRLPNGYLLPCVKPSVRPSTEQDS